MASTRPLAPALGLALGLALGGADVLARFLGLGHESLSVADGASVAERANKNGAAEAAPLVWV